jgi:hypothetical protein
VSVRLCWIDRLSCSDQSWRENQSREQSRLLDLQLTPRLEPDWLGGMATPTGGPGGAASAREITPAQLAATWKKSGGFDSLRKQLLADFINAVRTAAEDAKSSIQARLTGIRCVPQPEKDKFLADLDVSLPALLASTPSIARQERKDRPNAVIRSMKQIETLKPQIKLAEKRLREDETVAKRIDQELARSLCQLRGVPFVEEPKPKAAIPAEVGGGEGSGPSPVPKADERPSPFRSLSWLRIPC